jgi:hypothetical protein
MRFVAFVFSVSLPRCGGGVENRARELSVRFWAVHRLYSFYPGAARFLSKPFFHVVVTFC